MSLSYGVQDTFPPYVCSRHTCACGATMIEHGSHAGELPAGWVERADESGEIRCVCPHCAEAAPTSPG